MRIRCPYCDKKNEIKDELENTEVCCIFCGRKFIAPKSFCKEMNSMRFPVKQDNGVLIAFIIGALVLVGILWFNGRKPSRYSQPAPSDPVVVKYNALEFAENFAKEKLVSPSTAKFQKVHEDAVLENIVKTATNGDYEINSWVDSQNLYGAMIRKKFYVRLRKLSDTRFQMIGDVRFENF